MLTYLVIAWNPSIIMLPYPYHSYSNVYGFEVTDLAATDGRLWLWTKLAHGPYITVHPIVLSRFVFLSANVLD